MFSLGRDTVSLVPREGPGTSWAPRLLDKDWNVCSTSQLDLIQPSIDAKTTFDVRQILYGENNVPATFKVSINKKTAT